MPSNCAVVLCIWLEVLIILEHQDMLPSLSLAKLRVVLGDNLQRVCSLNCGLGKGGLGMSWFACSCWCLIGAGHI